MGDVENKFENYVRSRKSDHRPRGHEVCFVPVHLEIEECFTPNIHRAEDNTFLMRGQRVLSYLGYETINRAIRLNHPQCLEHLISLYLERSVTNIETLWLQRDHFDTTAMLRILLEHKFPVDEEALQFLYQYDSQIHPKNDDLY